MNSPMHNNIERLIKSAEAGDVDAMRSLAHAYKKGKGTEVDLDQYFLLMRQAAEAGDPIAMYFLAFAYKEGEGAEVNLEQYFLWITKSAEAGDADAKRSLALSYKKGEGAEVDLDQFFSLMKQAAEAGDPIAMYYLAFAYKEGEGTEVNLEQYFLWITKSAEAGDVDAIYFLALAYRDGEGTKIDLEQYFSWMKQAAETGDSYGMYFLGVAYARGMGAAVSLEQSFNWIKKSAENGNRFGMYELSAAYKNGKGIDVDEVMSFEWMKKSADADYTSAKFMTAMNYVRGYGCDADMLEARRMFQDAANDGDIRAFVALGVTKLEKDGHLKTGRVTGFLSDFISFYEKVHEIKESHRVDSDEAKEGVAHFTTFGAIENMLPVDGARKMNNHLRLYNISYVNDPQEGKRLIDADLNGMVNPLDSFFKNKKSDDGISEDDLLHHVYVWEGLEISIYSSSFTLNVDRLDLWRAYGGDGDGYCIVTPIKAFDDRCGNALIQAAVQQHKNEPFMKDDESTPYVDGNSRECSVPSALYEIKYETEDVEDTLNQLRPHLEQLLLNKNQLDTGKCMFNEIVRVILSDILYLYKNDEYRTENEARMVAAFNISSKELHLDENLPQRVYAETKRFLFKDKGSRIIIGPKVKDIVASNINIKYRLAKHDALGATSVGVSKVRYR